MNAPLLTERQGVIVMLPWPSAALAGHSDKHFWRMRPIIKEHREWALKATLAVRNQVRISLADDSDIGVKVTFIPPDRRGDRINFPNRLKPYFDGIADALCVNDRRFLPSYHFAEPSKPGKVTIEIAPCSAEMAVAA